MGGDQVGEGAFFQTQNGGGGGGLDFFHISLANNFNKYHNLVYVLEVGGGDFLCTQKWEVIFLFMNLDHIFMTSINLSQRYNPTINLLDNYTKLTFASKGSVTQSYRARPLVIIIFLRLFAEDEHKRGLT